MHYVMDDLEVDYLLDAVDFIASHGSTFLPLYNFDIYDGSWSKKDDPTSLQRFSLSSALKAGMEDEKPMPFEERQQRYDSYLAEAERIAKKLQKQKPSPDYELSGTLGELQFFALPECSMQTGSKKPRRGVLGKLKSVFSSHQGA